MSRGKEEDADGRLEDVRSRVLSGRFVSASEFLSLRENELRSAHAPGCYVILVYRGRIASLRTGGYTKGYVGQSVDVYRRVHDHLTGRGNQSVHADLRAGRRIMVQIVPCSEQSLNDMERTLISAMSRDRLYNQTMGGSAERCRDRSEFIVTDRKLLYPWEEPPGELCRMLASCYGRKRRRVVLKIDGIRVAPLTDGSLIGFDVSKGPHVVEASGTGMLSATARSKLDDGKEIVVTCGLIRIKIRVMRHNRKASSDHTVRRQDQCHEIRSAGWRSPPRGLDS